MIPGLESIGLDTRKGMLKVRDECPEGIGAKAEALPTVRADLC